MDSNSQQAHKVSPVIDWSKLRPYRDDQRKSFEELCYQIAKGLYGHMGIFTNVDDSGGGDGVEFYLILPDGNHWGWQAKFFKPGSEGRLKDGGRKGQIEDSLKTACKKHDRLKKWFLWTPLTFTPKEQKWFDDDLRKVLPASHRDLEMIHDDESDFLNWIREPRFVGIRNFFFGDLELTMDWFQRRFSEVIKQIGDKYVPGLHVATAVEGTLHAVVADREFLEELNEGIRDVEAKLASFVDAKRRLYWNEPAGIEWGNHKEELIKIADKIQYAISVQIAVLWKVFRRLNEQHPDLVREIRSGLTSTEVRKLCQEYIAEEQTIKINDIAYSGPADEEEEARHEASVTIDRPSSLAFSALRTLEELAKRLAWLTNPDLHILGSAHKGKTHLVTNFCREHLENECPTLLISGKDFRTNEPLKVQLLNVIGVPRTYGWDDFLAALDSAAVAYRTRIPIIIDGLNEAVVNGRFSQVWEQDLDKCIQSVAEHANVVLVTTCRSTYAAAIWPNLPKRTLTVHGFDWNEIRPAARRYFDYYKISPVLRTGALHQFRDPIYLRILCESVNPDQLEWKTVHVGNDSVFDIFDHYLNEKNKVLGRKLGRHNTVDLLVPALKGLAKYLLEKSSRTIPISEYTQIVDQRKLEQLDWETSLSKALLDEGLLISRDMRDSGEAVYFTYDMMAGYVMATSLAEDPDFGNTSWKRKVSDILFSPAITDSFPKAGGFRHPLAEDTTNSLAAIVLSRRGIYFHDIFPDPAAKKVSLDALYEISPDKLPDTYIDEVAKLFGDSANRLQLLQNAKFTMGLPEHALNIEFWSTLLHGLPLLERDASWTEFVRLETQWAEYVVDTLEQECRRTDDPCEEEAESFRLLAIQAMWFLTSTVRRLRDKATRALYWYGRCFPSQLFDMAVESLEINDPYIGERMLAAAYGIGMVKRSAIGKLVCSDVEFLTYARRLFDLMFAEGSPYATTHILSRDYSARTIEIALQISPSLLNEEETSLISPPFTGTGIQTWGEIEDPYGADWRSYEDPMQMDFANYTLGSLVHGRLPYEDTPEYRQLLQRIRWRIYDLGYSEKVFGQIDWDIRKEHSHLGRSANGGKTDRYGKKYSWIAYYEMAGIRQDQGMLREYENAGRFSADIDPSFPDDQEEEAVITMDLLGNRDTDLDQWIDDSPDPDLSDYLLVDKLQGIRGPWVLLDGHVSQQDELAHRKTFVFLRGLLVSSSESDDIVSALLGSYVNAKNLPDPSRDMGLFAGEVPWRYGLGHSGRTEIRIMCPDGTEGMHYELLLPVRDNVWGSGVSYANPGREISVPVREITECLDLVGIPQGFNMSDADGDPAVLSLTAGSHFYSQQDQSFIRKDLLERYLSQTGTELVWVVWGEREAKFDENSELTDFVEERRRKEKRAWGEFHTVRRSSELL